ncbi:MAG: fumarylacetoacetate hydrolase, partial [SAR324 cluster bacterium]|nr:fumarylacetoacetate hydrolase [SAR324 cluster bacterium]
MKVYDLSPHFPTISDLLEANDPARKIPECSGLKLIGKLEDLLSNTPIDHRDTNQPWLLAPCDLQAIKASGVTFVSSMLERVIEEQARGDWTKAEQIRKKICELIGDNLAEIQPGSDAAMKVKEVLIEQGAWSQYLEVGIGPDAEIFTKSQPMS